MPVLSNILRGLTRGADRHLRLTGKRGNKNFMTTRVKSAGIWRGCKFIIIKEKIPEIVVPDLKDFELKPYVSYRSPDILQEAITAKDIFDECLAPKVIEDYKAGKYDSLQTQEDLVKS